MDLLATDTMAVALSVRRCSIRDLSLIFAVVSFGCAGPQVPELDQAPHVVPAEEVTFRPLGSTQPDGAQVAVLWAVPSTDASATMLRFGRGGGVLHYHSADYHQLLIDGEMKPWLADEAEAESPLLGPGSFWYQPGGQSHADRCLSAQCTIFITWAGPRDAVASDTSS